MYAIIVTETKEISLRYGWNNYIFPFELHTNYTMGFFF
jgi:hypothetical protein